MNKELKNKIVDQLDYLNKVTGHDNGLGIAYIAEKINTLIIIRVTNSAVRDNTTWYVESITGSVDLTTNRWDVVKAIIETTKDED